MRRDGLRSLIKAVRTFAGPVYSAHSRNAQALRGPEAAQDFYLKAAQGAWLQTLQETCALLADVETLASLGFHTQLTAVPQNLQPADPILLFEKPLAERCFSLVLGILYARGSSMSWHTDCFPGLLALLCSGSEADKARCVEELRLDAEALKTCSEKGANCLFYKNVARCSPLQTKPMAEILPQLTDSPPLG